MDRWKLPHSLVMAAKASIGVLLLAAVVSTLIFALYCYGQVRHFYAGAQTLDATVTNLWLPPDTLESTFGQGMRFDVRLTTPLAGKEVVPMSGLYRVSTDADGSHIAVLHNPRNGMMAIRTPWNFVGAWFYAAISVVLLANACGWITLVRNWSRPIRLVSTLSACCCLAMLLALAQETRGQGSVPSPMPAQAVGQTTQPTEQNGASSGITTAEEIERTIKSRNLTKVFEVTHNVASTFQDGRPREVVFAGTEGKVILLPGETKLVELPKPVRAFFWQAGDAPVAVGDYESPVRATHVWCHRTNDGKVTWKLFSAEVAVPTSWFRTDPYPQLGQHGGSRNGVTRMELELVSFEPAQNELELSDEQRKLISDVNVAGLTFNPNGGLTSESTAARSRIMEILTPAQQSRLNQLLIQRFGFYALETDETRTKLALSIEQQTRIQKVWSDHTRRVSRLERSHNDLHRRLQIGEIQAEEWDRHDAEHQRLKLESEQQTWSDVYVCMTPSQHEEIEKLRGPHIKSAQKPPDAVPDGNGRNMQSAAIGLMLVKEAGNVIVGQIVPGSSAAREGSISIGDVIVSVSSGQKTITRLASPEEWTSENIVALIRGRPGETVTLEIVGPADPKGTPRKVTLTREVLSEQDVAKAKQATVENQADTVRDATKLVFFAAGKGFAGRTLTSDDQTQMLVWEGTQFNGVDLKTGQVIWHMRVALPNGSRLIAWKGEKVTVMTAQGEEEITLRPERKQAPALEDGNRPEAARPNNPVRKMSAQSAALWQELKGTWLLYAYVGTDGTVGRVTNILGSGAAVQFGDGTGQLTMGPGDEPEEFSFVIDAQQSPAEIDLKFGDGKFSLGLVELKNGTLSLRLADIGNDRPASMRSKEAADQNRGGSLSAKVMQYRRVKKSDLPNRADGPDAKPLTFEDVQNDEAQLRDLRRKLNDPSAVLSRELQGTWSMFRSIANDGTVDDLMVSGPSIHFDQDSGWLKTGAKEEQHKFSYVIDATKSPAEIDLKFAEGIDAPGLVELKDGTLSLRLPETNEKRPASMTSKDVSARVMQYRRVDSRDVREPSGVAPQSDEPKRDDIPENGANPKSEIPILNKLPYLNRLFKNPPRYQARIACFNGKVDSRSSCSTTNFQKDGALFATGKMKCGLPGHVSEIEWSCIERRDNTDVYRFTRRFPLDTPDVSTTSKDVEFSDARVIVFEDEFQVIVIEPPRK